MRSPRKLFVLKSQRDLTSHQAGATKVDSKKWEFGPGTLYGGFPAFLSFGV